MSLSIEEVYQSLKESLTDRFEIDLFPYTKSFNVIDKDCLSQFDQRLKDYYIAKVDGRYRFIFRSKFDYLKGLSDEQFDLLKSNDVTIEFFRDQIYLTIFNVEHDDLAEKIIFLADFLKTVYP